MENQWWIGMFWNQKRLSVSLTWNRLSIMEWKMMKIVYRNLVHLLHLLSNIERITSPISLSTKLKASFPWLVAPFLFCIRNLCQWVRFITMHWSIWIDWLWWLSHGWKGKIANSSFCTEKKKMSVSIKILTPCKLQHFTIKTAESMHIKSNDRRLAIRFSFTRQCIILLEFRLKARVMQKHVPSYREKKVWTAIKNKSKTFSNART